MNAHGESLEKRWPEEVEEPLEHAARQLLLFPLCEVVKSAQREVTHVHENDMSKYLITRDIRSNIPTVKFGKFYPEDTRQIFGANICCFLGAPQIWYLLLLFLSEIVKSEQQVVTHDNDTSRASTLSSLLSIQTITTSIIDIDKS